MQTYTLAEVSKLLGLPRPVISGLVAAGFVTPARGPRREYRFGFQDLVLLRAAQGLKEARLPAGRIARSLKALRARLPPEMPLAGLRLATVGNDIVVREGGGSPWQAASGQWLLDFGAAPQAAATAASSSSSASPAAGGAAAKVTSLGSGRLRATQRAEPGMLEPATPASSPASSPSTSPSTSATPPRARALAAADAWFQRGVELEPTDPAGAEAAYRHAIAAAPRRTEAYLNLGVLLGEAGRHAEAAAVAQLGIARCPPEPLLHFNLAVALEDAGQREAAVAAYERCLQLDPAVADAHFNLARLHDQLGRARQAIRHYSAYRRLHAPRG